MSEIDLIEFWFENPELWFNCSDQDDLWITNLFGNRVKFKILSSREDYLKNLEDIILLDQISRHVDRSWNTNFSKKYHSECLQISEKIIKQGFQDWLPEQICFLLMPMRHSNLQIYLEKSLNIITELRKADPQNNYYRRFYYANLNALGNFILPEKLDCKVSSSISEFSDMLCYTCEYKSIVESLWNSKLQSNNLLVKSFLKLKSDNPLLVISLSGGVDSMVSSFILKKLDFQVSALMINYQNREQSEREVQFVSSWCNRLKIPLMVTNINYLSRSRDSDRNFYEKFTNKIRFQSYRECGAPVILGHNMDDSLENIFSNIKNGKSFSNLIGMETHSYQQGVSLIRPMLQIRKSRILKFAHKYNIPYLLDSTPKWSQRANYRDNLIPSIEKYEPELIPSLIRMSKRYHRVCKYYYKFLEDKCDISKIEGDNQYRIKFIECFDYDYWKFIFEKCFQLYKLKVPSNKSIMHLISVLELSKNNIKGKSIMISNEYSGYFSDRDVLIITLNETKKIL